MSISFTFTILDDLEFEVVREVWNKYRIPEDRTVLKLKIVVTKILKTDKTDPITSLPIYATGHQTALSVKSELKGQPSPKLPTTQEELTNHELQEVKYQVEELDWNIYKVFDSQNVIQYEIQPVITSIYKVIGVFDQLGNPYYWVTSQIITRVKKL